MPKFRFAGYAILIGILAVPALYSSESTRAQEIADNCLQVISFSRTKYVVVQQQSEFVNTVRRFCNEYKRSKKDGDSANYGGTLKALSISMDQSASSEDNIAEKYCSLEGGTSKGSASYRQYISGISPGAYEAYEACLKAKDDGVTVRLAHTPRIKELNLVISFKDDSPDSQAKLRYAASKPVKCVWENKEGHDKETVIPNQHTTRLFCSRKNPRTKPVNHADYVHVIRVTGGATVLNFNWEKYDEEGFSYPIVSEIIEKFDKHMSDMQRSMVELEKRYSELSEETKRLSLASAHTLDVLLGELPVKENYGRTTYNLRRHVGRDATAVLVYAYLTTGARNNAEPADFRFSVTTSSGAFSTFLRARGYGQDAWSYNSDHFWMPFPVDGNLVIKWLGNAMLGNVYSGVRLIAYR